MSAFRTPRERLLQSLVLEVGGWILVTPLYATVFGVDLMTEALVIVAVVSMAGIAWSPLHNRIWDRCEWRLAGRVASQRPAGLRILHAISHEVSSAVVTVPLIMILSQSGFLQALLVDLGLSLFSAAWVLLCGLIWDRLRPMADIMPR